MENGARGIMKKIVQIVFITFYIKYVMLVPILTKFTPSAVAKCLIQILDTYFSTAQKLSVSFGGRTDVDDILQNLNIPVVVNTEEFRKELGVDKQVFTDVIVILDEIDVNYVLNTTLWYGDSTFLVMLKSSNSLMDVLSVFWSNKIVNVYILSEDNEDVVIYSFVPYGTANCGVGNPTIIDTWRDHEFGTGNISQIMDKEKIKDMNGCPINISIVDTKPYTIFDCSCNRTGDIDGIEGKIMLEVAKRLNFNAFFHLPRDGEAWGYVKPQPVGAIGDVYTGYSDFTIGMLGPVIGRYENLDFSIPYSPMECVTFGVPKGMREKQNVWISFLISEFTYPIWIAISLSLVITVITYMILIKIKRRKQFLSSTGVVFYVLSIAIGSPAKHPVYRELKLLYLIWAYAGYIFTALYQAALSSKLAVPTADKDIETFEQLLESELKLTGFKNVYTTLYYDREERNIGRMLDRYIITNQSIENAIEVMAKDREIAYIRHMSSFIYYSLLHESSRGEVNVLKDCIYVYYPTLMMKKYSPYTNQVNKIIDRLTRGGVIEHWLSFYIYNAPKFSDPVIKLSMEKLKGIFFFWMVGLVVAMLAFLCEVSYFISYGKVKEKSDLTKLKGFKKSKPRLLIM